ncbi:MAG: glycosyltransferase family 2 protein [Dehalococcoidia bacterium]|nr:glycosyltransferase family 2 protein [Dehalococcoidia bacterium]
MSAAVSVVIPTKGDRASLRPSLDAVLGQHPPPSEVLVVVQAAEAPALPRDGGVRVVLTPGRHGKSAALNDGLRLATSAALAFTDDDVVVRPGWLAQGLRRLEADTTLGLLFGRVLEAPHDRRHAVVPAFAARQATRRTGFAARARLNGIGGNVFARRTLFTAIGPFDEELGAGTRFPAAEDLDIAQRAARAGFAIGYEPRAVAVHHGARTFAEGASVRLWRSYSRGLGALVAKDLRLRDPAVLVHVAREVSWDAESLLLRLLGRSPEPWAARTPALLRGFWEALRVPLDSRGAFWPSDNRPR